MKEYLRNVPNILLIEPVEYVAFVDLMRRAHLLLTDSGGVQEEAPSLGKTGSRDAAGDRASGSSRGRKQPECLLGTDEDKIVAEAALLLDDPQEYARRARIHNPYGDGQASTRIRDVLAARFSKR